MIFLGNNNPFLYLLFCEVSDLLFLCTKHLKDQMTKPKELIDNNWAIGMKRLGDIVREEKSKKENEDAYSEIRLQMHNHLIKKLRSLKGEWKLDNISQVTERIILAFFKNDLD